MRRIVLLIALLTMTDASDDHHRAFGVDLESIALMGSQQASRIETIEFVSTGTYFKHRYVHAGEEFRFEYLQKGGEDFGGVPVRINTFDGTKYFELEKGKYLSFGRAPDSERPLEICSNPLLLPYEWLFYGHRGCTWSTVCNPDAWREALRTGVYLGKCDVNRTRCCQIRIELGKARVDLALAKDFRFFPMQWVAHSLLHEEEICSARVDRFTVYDAIDGPVIIPLETVSHQPLQADNVERRFAMLEPSLRVGCPVDQSIFSLADIRAERVFNRDQLQSLRIRIDKRSGGDDTLRVWFLLVGELALIAVLVLLSRKRRTNLL
jgi:hypothetical protein